MSSELHLSTTIFFNWESTPWYTHAYLSLSSHTKVNKENTRNIKREINEVLPEGKKMQLVYTGTKYNVTDKTKKEHHQFYL